MSKKLTTEEFIIKARLIHGDRYNYSETIYSGRHSKLKIFCNIHKEFFEQVQLVVHVPSDRLTTLQESIPETELTVPDV